MQLTHYDIQNQKHSKEITLVLDQVFSPDNIGLLLRTAEAFGIKKVYIISHIYDHLTRKIKRATRSVENEILIQFFNSPDEVFTLCKNTSIICLEHTSKSKKHTLIDSKTDHSLTIVVGNERQGISDYWLEKTSEHYHIQMFGKNSSMNVAVATGIFLAEICK